MTQEEKQLLLKDICGRIPYGVQVFVERDKCAQATLLGVDVKQFSIVFGGNNWSSTSNIEGHHIEQYKQIIKLYLRPMTSMTEEEDKEFWKIVDNYGSDTDAFDGFELGDDVDWLNAHHFDYRGLIEKGLALKAPEGMYTVDVLN